MAKTFWNELTGYLKYLWKEVGIYFAAVCGLATVGYLFARHRWILIIVIVAYVLVITWKSYKRGVR